MRWQENVLDGQVMDWFPSLPTRKKYLFMGFNKSTLFFISKILYLSYCKIDNQTSELCNFTQVKSLFFIMAYQFSGKKMGGKIILKCILLWLEILFGRWHGMKQGQHWWKLAQMYCCVGNVLNSWLFSLTKLTIWLLHIAWAINFQYCTNQPYILSIAMLLFYYYGREFLVLSNVMCWMW